MKEKNENLKPEVEKGETQEEIAKHIVIRVRLEPHVEQPKDMAKWLTDNFTITRKTDDQKT